jgi:hypothetical protein
MNVIQLRDYDNWVGQNAQTILNAVYAHGGWHRVFPQNEYAFPLWLSRVRNYFNYYPKKLRILGLAEGEQRSRMANHYHDYPGVVAQMTIGKTWGLPYADADSKAKAADALSEYVYRDGEGNYWFQMSPGATGYHFKDSWLDFSRDFKAVKSTIKGQGALPVFKLISPDISGGSYEIIIKRDKEVQNWHDLINGEYDYSSFHKNAGLTLQAFKNKNKYFAVSGKNFVTDYKYEGSYNFSETIKNGFSAHDYRDIKSHRTHHGFYVNPPFNALQQPLISRFFPEKDSFGHRINLRTEDVVKRMQKYWFY